MRRRLGIATLAALLLAATPTTATPTTATPTAADPAGTARPQWPQGVHPWPTGDEWPRHLTGPFQRAEPEAVSVTSHDGTVLQGWIQRPVVPAGTKLPVVLSSGPYYGQEEPTGDVDELDTPRWLVDHGFAVASFNVRGTGNSGGCFEFFGPNEQKDQAVLVEWLGNQKWSNGRVGMWGLSYLGTTPWEAAIQNPKHLKTIVVAGMVADPYHFFHSPQGAPFTISGPFTTAYVTLVSANPPVFGGARHATIDHLPVVPQRLCPELVDFVRNTYTGTVTDDRGAEMWKARQLSTRFGDVRTSVFLTHGFQDLWGSGHAFQEDYVWRMLRRAPKRMLEGQWAHEFPTAENWRATVVPWLDFWLKGIGRPPGVGRVDYEDGAGTWRRTTAWPPPANQEVLHLAGPALRRDPADTSRRLVSAQGLVSAYSTQPPELLCPLDVPSAPSTRLVHVTAPATRKTHVAGNPFLHLNLTSDQPGGLLGAYLVDLSPDFTCVGATPAGNFRFLTSGAADLRFHAGGFTGRPFPVGRPTAVRIDLASLAETIEPGHRLALVLSSGDVLDRTAQPYPAVLDVQPGSHVVLPVASGTFGGKRPTMRYPGNPFPGWVP